MMTRYQYYGHLVYRHPEPFISKGEKECAQLLSRGKYLTPDEKKRAIAYNEKQRKKKQ